MERMYPEEDFSKRSPGRQWAFDESWPEWLTELGRVQRGILEDRKSVKLHEVQFRELVADPVDTLTRIGLPERSASAIDATLYRNRAA
jgi:hypothetical protein